MTSISDSLQELGKKKDKLEMKIFKFLRENIGCIKLPRDVRLTSINTPFLETTQIEDDERRYLFTRSKVNLSLDI